MRIKAKYLYHLHYYEKMKEKKIKPKLRVPLMYVAEVVGHSYHHARRRRPIHEKAEQILYPHIREAILRAKEEMNTYTRNQNINQ